MLLPRRFRLSSILAFVLASIWAEAQAGFVTNTYSTPSQMRTDFTQTLAVKPFDTKLGTLESVVITVADEANLNGTLKNKSASARTFTITEDVIFNATFSNVVALSDDLNASKTYTQLATGATAIFGSYSLSGHTNTQTVTQQTLLNEFISPTVLNFTMATQTETVVGGSGGNTSSAFVTTADATLTITYNYLSPSIVPEPASLAMTALGGILAATASYARMRKRSRDRAGVIG